MSTDMSGKVVLVTGGTSGIGEATATALASQRATVVIGGRDAAQAEGARSHIASTSGNDDVHVALADLSAQSGVRGLAADVTQRWDRLDVLVNNAGVDVGRRSTTPDGLELTFAVNFLAPFLLTALLLDRLEASAPARVVNLASGAHKGGELDFDDLQSEHHFSQKAYNNSKLALIMWTYELARRVDPDKVTVNAVDPGFVRGTNLGRTLRLPYQAIGMLMTPFMARPGKGAESVVWAATDPALAGVSGAYLKNGRQAQSSARSRDAASAARLWQVASDLVGLAHPPGA